MSLTGAVAPRSVLAGSQETRRERREQAARGARPRGGAVRGAALVVATISTLALAALVVLPLLGVKHPVDALEGLGSVATAAPPAAAADVVVPARVVATSSCLAPGAHDTVLVEIAGAVRQFPLDGCGSPIGRWVTVVAPETGTAGTARVLGTGATAPAAATPNAGRAPSPMTERLSLVLTVVAALGTGGLVVAVARDRSRRARRTGPARGSARGSARGPARGSARGSASARRAAPAAPVARPSGRRRPQARRGAPTARH